MAKEDEDQRAVYQFGAPGHEARIARLEDELSDLRVQSAEISTDLKHLGTQVEVSSLRISDKIDLCIKPLTETLHDHFKDDAATNAKLVNLASTVTHLDDLATARAVRWSTWKKAIATLTLGGGAIGLKELVVYVVTTFKHAT